MKTAIQKRVYFCFTLVLLLAFACTALNVQSAEGKSPAAKRAATAAAVEETQAVPADADDSYSDAQTESDQSSGSEQTASERPRETDPYKTATGGQVGVSLFNVLFNALTIYLCIVLAVAVLGFGGVFFGALVWHVGKACRGGGPPVIG